MRQIENSDIGQHDRNLTKLENPKPSARVDSDSLEVSGLLTFVSGCIFRGIYFKVTQWTDYHFW